MGPIGAGSRIEYGATGDVLNTAARLQSHALPGRVLVGSTTRAMTGDRFTWEQQKQYDLKGKQVKVEAALAIADGTPPALA